MLDSLKSAIAGFLGKEEEFYQQAKVNDLLADLRSELLNSDISVAFVNNIIDNIRIKLTSIANDHSISIKKHIFNIVYAEIERILGGNFKEISLQKDKMTIIMLCGPQGVGKTSFCVKLCNRIKQTKPGVRIATCSVDIKRPAAHEQLKTNAKLANIDYIGSNDLKFINMSQYASYLHQMAIRSGYSALIVDTQGTSPINMLDIKRLYSVKEAIKPDEVLLVLDSTVGQVATSIATKFDSLIGVTGVVLTKADSDANIGVAINVRNSIGKPIKYLSIGEKKCDIEEFYPNRIAKRILNIKDSEGLAEHLIHINKSVDPEHKALNGKFDFNDLYEQLLTIKNNLNVGYIMSFFPTKSNVDKADKQKLLTKQLSIILSMTLAERQNPELMSDSRKKRIANGSGTLISDVNETLNRLIRLRKALLANATS